MSRRSIFDFVPKGYELRDVQRKVLQEIEENWEEYDIFVVDAPVAAGKSLISVIVSNWRNSFEESAAVLTPKAMLQDQYQKDFPKIPSLKGKAKYPCKLPEYKSCDEYYEAAGFYCCGGGCNYKSAMTEAQESKQVILNFHSHLFSGMVHNMYKDVLIIDEAHNLVPMLSDIYSLNIWKHKDKYPHQTYTKDDIIIWLSDEIGHLESDVRRIRAIYKDVTSMPDSVRKSLKEATRKLMKFKMIRDGLKVPQELFNIALTRKTYGRSKKQHECIEVKPISLKTVPHQMWPDGEVKKIVLMSATVYDKDIERLGISRKRVKYVKCDSPIPSENRPIIVAPIASMSFKNVKESTPIICNKIKELAEKHQGKGVIHITYGLINEFKKYLKGDRFLWHTEKTRESAYKKFRKADSNVILMACGMGEGIDLAGSDYEWQVIAKAVFPSLADPLQQHFLQNDPKVYNLETARIAVQQVGRICRTPTDYGVTYIVDSSFANFYKRNFKLFPKYFVDAMKWEKI
jgi:Rad3-related DNA helicase